MFCVGPVALSSSASESSTTTHSMHTCRQWALCVMVGMGAVSDGGDESARHEPHTRIINAGVEAVGLAPPPLELALDDMRDEAAAEES